MLSFWDAVQLGWGRDVGFHQQLSPLGALVCVCDSSYVSMHHSGTLGEKVILFNQRIDSLMA